MTDSINLAQGWQTLASNLTTRRKQRMELVAGQRTNWLRLVVQDIHHPHNISACLRSAEAFGIQNVHIVTLRERFRPSDVAQGVAGWLTIHKHESVAECANELIRSGYHLAAGLPPHLAQSSLGELRVDRPVAIVFGNEHQGIDPSWDEFLHTSFTIPMQGMVESLNISVSAAITMHELTTRARSQVAQETYFLSQTDRLALLCHWGQQKLKS